MTPRRTLSLALLLFFPLTSLGAQDQPPSAAILIEKARILAEEKGDPKAAVKLLVDQVICRKDLSKVQFDKTANMIALYGGGTVRTERRVFSKNHVPRQDLTRLIDKEIDAYLAGDGKALDKIFWYGKAAVPLLIRRLNRDYFKAQVADLLVPLIVSSLDMRAAADFLRQLREKGPEKFRAIVAKAMNTSRSNVGAEPMGPLMDELIVWIRTRQEGAQLLDRFWQDVKPDDFTLLLDRRSSDWDPLNVAYLLTHRDEVARLENPQPLFQIVLQEVAKAHAGQTVARMGNDIFPWLLHQEGGFDVFAQAIGVRSWYFPTIRSLVNDAPSFPDEVEGLTALLSQMKNWGDYRKPYEFLDDCLQTVWKDTIDRPDPKLQKLFVDGMGILNELQRVAEARRSGPMRENKYMWGTLKGRLLSRVVRAPVDFQESLWKAPLAYKSVSRFPDLGLPSESLPHYEPAQWSVGALLLNRTENQQPLIPSAIDEDARIRIDLHTLASGNYFGADAVFWKMKAVYLPGSIREKLFLEFDRRKDLLQGQKQRGVTRLWTLLPRGQEGLAGAERLARVQGCGLEGGGRGLGRTDPVRQVTLSWWEQETWKRGAEWGLQACKTAADGGMRRPVPHCGTGPFPRNQEQHGQERESISVSFTPEQAEFLVSCVDTGRYQFLSEVVREAVRLLEDQQLQRQTQIQRALHLIEEGARQLDGGEEIDMDSVLGDLTSKHERLGGPEDER